MKTALLLFLPISVMLFLVPAIAKVSHDDGWDVKQCLECHPRSHPTHRPMVPDEMRADMPLDERGRMQCSTCHKCIAGTCRIPQDRTELCRVCHDCTQGMACILQTAHIGDSGDIRYLATQRCLDCHGKTLNIKVCDLGNKTLDVLFFQSNMDSLKQSPEGRVVLVEGKVTCLSCHDPYSSQRARLIMSNRESGMCLACHTKLESVDHSGYGEGMQACLGCHPRVWPTHRRTVADPSNTKLPLDAQNRVLCMTCHDCVTGTCLLRLEKPELCASCHDCTQGMACLLGSAHLGKSRGGKGITRKGCLECHDNATAESCGLGDGPDDKSQRINCTSCHNPYSSRHSKLLKGVDKADIIQQVMCPRNMVQNITDCMECHVENR